MITLLAGSCIWIVAGITGLSKGFNVLTELVQNTLKGGRISG
ncbi:hypothetical protein [Kosakonia sp. S42]|nr:hypothetical protein [Kosakonia sp. S42]